MSALAGFCEEDTQFVILAVDEACANIIRHAYAGRTDGEIRISVHTRADGIEFLLVDQGLPADPSCFPERSLDEVRPGGLGLPLIQAIARGAAAAMNCCWGNYYIRHRNRLKYC
jgi:anti-sigma regulatory factor (Ser/Thr protein kinase)